MAIAEHPKGGTAYFYNLKINIFHKNGLCRLGSFFCITLLE
jgi:hypothetical protein